MLAPRFAIYCPKVSTIRNRYQSNFNKGKILRSVLRAARTGNWFSMSRSKCGTYAGCRSKRDVWYNGVKLWVG